MSVVIVVLIQTIILFDFLEAHPSTLRIKRDHKPWASPRRCASNNGIQHVVKTDEALVILQKRSFGAIHCVFFPSFEARSAELPGLGTIVGMVLYGRQSSM